MAAGRRFTTKEAAKHLGIEAETLRRWRFENRGPAYVKADGESGAIRYRESDLDEWEESHLVRPATP